MVHKTFKVAEVQLTYKPKYKLAERPVITSSKDAYDIFLRQWSLERIGFLEESKLLLLNRRNSVLGIVDISMGGLSGTVVDPKVIFVIALKAGASALILAHNHPSEKLDPSQQDLLLTKKLKEGGNLIDISVLDHLIISKDGYSSMMEDGHM
ncbi:MAG: JAB domain-containing protein [Pedobacter sp.]